MEIDTARNRIECALLGGERKYTPVQVAELAGVPQERSRKLWRALGFSDNPDDAVVATDADVEALRLAEGLVQLGVIDEDLQASITRTMGQSIGRLAEWQVGMIRHFLPDPSSMEQPETAQLIEGLIPVLEKLQLYVWRRHLAAEAGRTLAVSSDELDSRTLVVGFADIVSFTSLSRRLDEAHLGEFIERFEATAAETVTLGGGRVVKTLGDEVLYVADTATEGAEIALDLDERMAVDEELPTLRIGMAHGTVLSRFGDVYGSVVNLASRLTSVAKPGTVVVDREMAAALGDEPAYAVRRLRPRSVRGFKHLEPWSLRRSAEQESGCRLRPGR
jgi:adenylate cyclase